MSYDPVAKLIRFNEIYNDDGSGGAWTLEGRDFIRDEIYTPLHSYARVPAAGNPPEALCPACKLQNGSWLFDPFDAPLHKPTQSCVGLIGVPIVSVGADVPRQSGKTTTALSIPFARLFVDTHEHVSFVAAAEDQAIELVIQKLANKIERHPALKKLAHVTSNKIIVERNHCQLEILPASHGSATGRTTTLNEYDECRDQKARVVTAAMPSILAQHGYKCEAGHGRWRARPNGEPEFECCPAMIGKSRTNKKKCGLRLRRWHARQLFLSASGVIEDNPSKDWFRDWIDNRLERPDAYTHVWRSDKKINPSVSTEIHDGISRSFGDVPGMRDHLGVELHNAPIRLGESFVTVEEYDSAVDHNVRPVPGSPKPALAFIDSSRTNDKTSLVILVESNALGQQESFGRLDLAYIQVWDPHDVETCPDGVVDEQLVGDALNSVLPSFPNILRLCIDTRLMHWPKQLVKTLKRQFGGRKIIDTEGWTNTVNSAMYLELHQRLRAKTLRLWPCLQPFQGRRCNVCNSCELRSEMLAMRKRDLPGGGIEVHDAGGNSAGRNRRKGGIHRDVAMSVAGCCYLASILRLELHRGEAARVLAANRRTGLKTSLGLVVKPKRQY